MSQFHPVLALPWLSSRKSGCGRMPPSTVEGVVLLGWLERDFAVTFLLNECVTDPPLDEQGAEGLWRRHREQVDAMPGRDCRAPDRLPLTAEDRRQADTFLRFHGVPQR